MRQEFDEFAVSIGLLPAKPASLTLKAIQTYDNGDVVRWIDVAAKGQPEPDHPAPVLTVAADAAAASDSSDDTARGLAVIGIVASVVGVGLGGVAVRGRRNVAR
jgi:hypothetical protein